MARKRREPGIYQRDGRYYFSWHLSGKGSQQLALIPMGETRGTKDLTIANQLAADIRASGLTAPQITAMRKTGNHKPKSKVGRKAKVIDLAPSLKKLLDAFETANMDHATAEQAHRNARKVAAFMDDQSITDAATITPASIANHLADLKVQGVAASTRAKSRTALSTFCKFCVARGILKHNPARDVRGPKITLPPPKYLTQADYDKTLELAKEHDIEAEVSMALWTGMRRGEIADLRWGQVDWDGRKIMILKSKTNSARSVPMKDDLAKVLADYALATTGKKRPARGRVFHDGKGGARTLWRWCHTLDKIKEQVPTFSESSGTGAAWHLLRHTFASRLVQAGVPLRTVAGWMGHSTIQTTMRYAHLAPTYDDAIENA
ncbi:MAG: site-specific integrase [Phycisphaerae bacterium]|nr:site-specific integrase [Phycisphaerae bacterium]